MMDKSDSKLSSFRKRSSWIVLFLFFWALLAVLHIFYYSCFRRERLLEESQQIAWREGSTPSVRGRIFSSDYFPLAWSELCHDLWLDKKCSGRRKKEIFAVLKWKEVPFSDSVHDDLILLKRDLTPGEIVAMAGSLSSCPELRVIPRMERKRSLRLLWGRPTGQTLAVSEERPEEHGISGFEGKYDSILSGRAGTIRVMLDRRRNWVPGTVEVQNEPIPGSDVRLIQTLRELEWLP